MNTSQIKEVSADGDVTTADAHLRLVSLTAGSDAATLVVKAGGSSGTTVLTLKAAANTSVVAPCLTDAFCANGVHADLTGTGPVATFVYVA
ncbi:MAG TPA: hypothetical protein VGX25_05435 [Actinophytocola sp.]|uniref:hypothetical protein n=1 Tax=Actinophytocola sp. TaxID=1872138 RepID=UPI002DDCD83A|nr:hypothetical protein [Actinophytocola sp.]HEV2778825.1 hypothetical protein [Actinophytocola sp.]